MIKVLKSMLLCAGLVLALAVPEAQALPRYAAEYGQSCHLCHVSPSGGGMRTSYGSQFFAGTELSSRSLDFGELEKLSPKLSERVDVGLDFRGMYFAESKDDELETEIPATEMNSFFQMQGDLYLRFKLSETVEMVLDKGLRQGYEAWALLHGLPGKGSVKVGRFQPFYGWRWVDHDMSTRKYLGFSQNDADTGVEVEFHPDHWSFALALGNGSSGLLDENQGKALTGRAAWNGRAGKSAITIGLSARAVDAAPARSWQMGGLFAGASLGQLTWTGELDLRTDGDTDALAFANEFAWKQHQGVELLLSYDFWDPDLDLQDGFDTRLRLALDWIPSPVFSLQPGLAMLQHDNGSGSDSWLLFDLQLHLFM